MPTNPLEDRMQEHWWKCIQRAEAILPGMNPADDPLYWAASQRDLGCCYSKLSRGSVPRNLERAIACFHAALQIYTEEEHPPFWAATQSNLGDVYAKRQGERRGNDLRRALVCYEGLLRVYTREAYPQQWTMTQGKLERVRTELEQLNHA